MRVLVIDDHPLFVVGLLVLLRELDAEGQLESAASLVDCVTRHSDRAFDLVLLDMNLPGTSHLDVLTKVQRLFPAAEVVVISAEDHPDLIYAAIDAGAAGYVPKHTNAEQTKRALQLVLAGGTYLPKALLHRVAPASKAVPAAASLFSDRQLEVLRLLNEGLPNKSIARQLDIAEGTVKAHLSAIFGVLDVRTRLQAMRKSNELGLVSSFGRPDAEGRGASA